METAKTALTATAMAALLVLAGCAGPIGTDGPTASDGASVDDGATPDEGTVAGSAGTVEFYVSDEENAIEDFEHLNVTVTKVGFHRVDDGDEENAESGEIDDETATPNATATPDGTATPTPTPTPESDEDDEGDEGDDEEDDEGDDDGGDGEWVEYEVNRTVDLTELRGANATKLGDLVAPNGTYDKVFVHVDGIDATLQNGEQVNVKLPSNKLQINKRFTVGDGERVKFVFDLSVHEAGNSGKYILKPVIGQSGTSEDVDIEDVDEREDDERDDDGDGEDEADDERNETAEGEGDNETEEAGTELTAEFVGPVRAGEDATVKVTGSSGPVANATVAVNGETVGTTDDSGRITVAVPEDAEEIEVEVTKGEAEAEIERTVEKGGGGQSLRAPG